MSKEAAAATLTQIYFACSEVASKTIDGQIRAGGGSAVPIPGATERIGMVYGAFFRSLEMFEKMQLPGQKS